MQKDKLFQKLNIIKSKYYACIKTDMNRKRCFGFTRKGKAIYYAISGLDEMEPYGEKIFKSVDENIVKIFKMIKHINIVNRCYIEDSFNSCNYKYEIVKVEENKIYKYLKQNIGQNCNVRLKYPLNSNPIKYSNININNKKNIITRNFSCVEKKIVGKISNNCSLYISKRPCYFCIPEITKAYFFSEQAKYCIKVKKLSNILCKIKLDIFN